MNDSSAIAIQDRIVDGERRWQTIGMTPTGRLLLVAHTSEQDSLDDEIIRIISARSATRRKDDDTRPNDVVTYEFDPSNPPPLTEDEKAQLDYLATLPDEDIDTSDIPEADEDFWARAVRNPFFRPVKQQLTLRLDADLVAWFKAQSPDGKGYQTAINDALRRHVRREQARDR